LASIIKLGSRIVTIERHILDRQHDFPDATGTLTSLLYDMAVAGKLISSHTTRAGLADILGGTGEENVQGEEVQFLDEYAHRAIFQLNDHTGRLAVMGSEEAPEIVPIPEKYPTGKYVLLFDPLDGSSNIDFNVSVGTIFAIFRRKTTSGPGRSWLHSRPEYWRVSAIPSQYSPAGTAEVLQRQPGLPEPLE
jgi:fructose-1,6-bisphosphatase I